MKQMMYCPLRAAPWTIPSGDNMKHTFREIYRFGRTKQKINREQNSKQGCSWHNVNQYFLPYCHLSHKCRKHSNRKEKDKVQYCDHKKRRSRYHSPFFCIICSIHSPFIVSCIIKALNFCRIYYSYNSKWQATKQGCENRRDKPIVRHRANLSFICCLIEIWKLRVLNRSRHVIILLLAWLLDIWVEQESQLAHISCFEPIGHTCLPNRSVGLNFSSQTFRVKRSALLLCCFFNVIKTFHANTNMILEYVKLFEKQR